MCVPSGVLLGVGRFVVADGGGGRADGGTDRDRELSCAGYDFEDVPLRGRCLRGDHIEPSRPTDCFVMSKECMSCACYGAKRGLAGAQVWAANLVMLGGKNCAQGRSRAVAIMAVQMPTCSYFRFCTQTGCIKCRASLLELEGLCRW